jgi:pimeloyl-ACP methyl ester carboxylesterase
MERNHRLPGYFSVGEGPAVVLLHCTLSSKKQWRGLSGMLSRHNRVIGVDLYGYGETGMPEHPEQFTLLDEVMLVKSLLEELLPKGETIRLVGHSYGGAVALRFCHRFPESATALTVFEPVAFHLLPPGDPELAPVLSMMRTLQTLISAEKRAEAVETFIDYWSGAGSFGKLPGRVQQEFVSKADKLLLDIRALTRNAPVLEEYRQLRLPVTLITGEASKGPSLRVAGQLALTLPDCSTVSVATGHMGPVTDPEVVNPIIRESLRRGSGSQLAR